MKRLFILLVALLPLGLFAQGLKIAHVDFQSVLIALPEMDKCEKELAAVSEQYSKEFQTMQDDYTKKIEDYQKNEKDMTDNIKTRRIEEIEGMRERIENFVVSSQEELKKKEADLLQPLYEKVEKAIKAVGEENKFTAIMPAQSFFYLGNDLIDATPLVRKKLGL